MVLLTNFIVGFEGRVGLLFSVSYLFTGSVLSENGEAGTGTTVD